MERLTKLQWLKVGLLLGGKILVVLLIETYIK
jgi:hypothetical protein